jgi:putative Mn2+ efflux pump MntP
MTFPTFLLGTLIAMIIGCGFHFWRGGGLKWLITFNIFSIVGFWIGHFVGILFKVKFLQVGPINLGPAIVASVVLLFAGYWLSMASVEPETKEQEKPRGKND